MEYICFERKKTTIFPYQAIMIIIISLLCSRFLVAYFTYTTSLKGSVLPCFGISNRNPLAHVFWSYVFLTPSCQVTWVLVNVVIHKVARTIESYYVWAPLIYLLFTINSTHLYPFWPLSVCLINEVYFSLRPVFPLVFWLTLKFGFSDCG